MPAPHDKRFVKIYRKAQRVHLWTDAELLMHFEGALEQVIECMPDIPEDEAILKALRSWVRFLFPGVDLPRLLSYEKETDWVPKYGDAVVALSSTPGTFCWNNITNGVQWAWFNPSPGDGGKFQDTDPSLKVEEEIGDDSGNGNMAPSSTNNQENNRNDISAALTASSLHGGIKFSPVESKVLEFRFNEYSSLEPFIAAKALRAGFSQEQLDDGWMKSSDQSWERFGDHGQAYVQYMAEASYWCWMFRDEVFPGRNPVTGEYHMYTHNEMVESPELTFKEPELRGYARTPLSSPERPIKRVGASTTNSQ
ncbi:uncharacterized protein RSE6_01968 [Rhynchosporium secalis]|uniref:Uncharacterized protein n=1 Tax=Rhynchosporium secalis TaxID=38038 RepID=A0A1E1LZ34_RHYSE|nr:uncharacterized protein RSE6_01968 [Rhynchosporium secalis]